MPIRHFYLLSLCTAAALFAETKSPVTEGYLELLPMDTFVDTLSIEQLSQVIVTDTKIAQSTQSVTQRIETIPFTQFERLNDNRRNLAELLQYTSGQFVNVLSRNDANWGSYAGLGAKYNTYMLDGLPIDSFVDAMSLDPWAFERVEIQKGPASILYSNYMSMDFAGNESPLAGTTNFILKEKIDRELSRVQLSAGSYNTRDLRAYHQNRNGSLNYFFGTNIESSDYTRYGQDGTWLQTTERPDYRKAKFYGKASYEFSPGHSISLFYHLTDHDGDMGRPNRDFDHRYQTLNLKYQAALNDDLLLQIQGGIRDYSRTFINDNYPVSIDYTNSDHYDQTVIPIDLTLNYLHANGSIFTVGSDYQKTVFKSYRTDQSSTVTSQNDVKAVSNSLFAQEKIVYGDWVFRGGVRFNRIEHDYEQLGGTVPAQQNASWSKTLWNIGARWNVNPDFSWYANSGTGFMTPSAKQVGGTVSNPLTDSGQIANPSLQSELGSGNDIGIEWHPTQQWNLGMRLFYNLIDDAIVDSVVSTSPSQSQSFNAGSAESRGIELDISHHVDETLEYFANVTLSDTRIKDSKNSANNGSDIPFVPDYVANIGVSASTLWDISGSLYCQRVGKYYDSASKTDRIQYGNYTLLNAKLQKNILRNERYSISTLIDLNNITDKRYVMPWGFSDPGFNATANLVITF